MRQGGDNTPALWDEGLFFFFFSPVLRIKSVIIWPRHFSWATSRSLHLAVDFRSVFYMVH